MPTRGSHKAHVEKARKKFVSQRLGVSPKSCVLVLFWQFWSVLNCFPSCEQAWLKYTTSNRQSTIIIINILILNNGQHQLNKNMYFLSRVLNKHWVPKGPQSFWRILLKIYLYNLKIAINWKLCRKFWYFFTNRQWLPTVMDAFFQHQFSCFVLKKFVVCCFSEPLIQKKRGEEPSSIGGKRVFSTFQMFSNISKRLQYFTKLGNSGLGTK